MATLRVLSAQDVQRALTMEDAIDAMRAAFTALYRGEALVPQRIHLETNGGTALFMPAALSSDLGIKTVTLFPENPAKGHPYIQGTYCLFDGTTGTPTAFMDSGALTALRTGAASGLATDLLARSNASVAAILGAGVQGRTQLRAVCSVRSIRRVNVYDPVKGAADTFAREMSSMLGLPVSVCDTPADAVADADVVCAATVSRTPVFHDSALKDGVHLNAVGSYKPDVQEIAAETVLRAKIVVDQRTAALAETGDLIIPIRDGKMTANRIYAELGELTTGDKPGRVDESEVTLFKSVGLAVQDLAAARRVLAIAVERNIGTVMEM